jgi:nucleotide-binding universal stress UspA family protein
MNENAASETRAGAARVGDESPRPVVVGVDGSQSAYHAALWAAGEAERRATSLTLVHSIHIPDAAGGSTPLDQIEIAERRRAEGRELLDRAAAALRGRRPELMLDLTITDLDPADLLANLSRDAAVLVTGTRGRGGFTGMLLGSVARKLAAHSRCPLVVVREAPPEDGTGEVVLGVGRKHSPAAARFAFEAARLHGAPLTAVQAWWPHAIYSSVTGPGSMFIGAIETLCEDALAAAAAAIEPLTGEFPDVKVRAGAVEGNTVPALIDAARGARLIVVAGHRQRGPLASGAGYVVEGLLAHSPTPVAVVPTVP